MFTLVFLNVTIYIYIYLYLYTYLYIYIHTHFIFYTHVFVSLNFVSLHFSFPWTWLQVCQRSEGRCRMPSCGQSCPPATCLLASSTWGWIFLNANYHTSFSRWSATQNMFVQFSPPKFGEDSHFD